MSTKLNSKLSDKDKKSFRSFFITLILTCLFAEAYPQANTALSNLGTTSVNQSLIPGTDNSKNLGSSTKSWKDIYLDGIVYLDGQKFLTNGSYSGNTFVGIAAGNNTTGSSNTFTGNQSGYYNAGGNYNTGNGYGSLFYNNSGYSNAAFGYKALYSNTSGYENTATGTNALRLTTVGNHNSAQGYDALYNNSTGGYNTAAGYYALHDNTSDDYNTAFGTHSGDLSTNSDWSSFFGYYAGCSFASAGMDHSTAVGYNSKVTGPDQVKIGNSSTGSIGGYTDWTNFSDGRYKKEVKEDVKGLEFINKLRPITYHLDVTGLRTKLGEANADANGISSEEQKSIEKKESVVYSGFIAQEVEKAAQEINYDFSGVDVPENDNSLYGLRYAAFVVPLVKAVQELDAENGKLKSDNGVLKSEVESQKSEIEELKSRLDKIEETLNSNSGNISSEQKNNFEAVELDGNSAKLEQNIPNPFNQSTIINYFLPETIISAQINFYDQRGMLLKSIPLNEKGTGSIELQQRDLAAGTYSYQLVVDGKVIDTKKMEHIRY